MSIGLLQEPLKLSPIGNPVPIVVSSSNSTTAGFRYRVDLINDSGDDELAVWVYPDTNNGHYGIYDFSRVLSDLIGSNPEHWGTDTCIVDTEQILSYNYRVTEYINATSGATLSGSTDFNVFRGVKQYGDYWDIETYLPNTTGDPALFASISQKREYKLTETATINTFEGSFGTISSEWDTIVINVFTSSYVTPYQIQKAAPSGGEVVILPLGPKNINDMAATGVVLNMIGGGTGVVDLGPIIDTDTIKYDFYLESKGIIVTEKLIVNVDNICYKHDGVEFLWLGELGTFESYTFRMADLKSFKTARNEVKSNHYSIKSNQYTYSIGDRGRTNINVSTTESHSAISGWIGDVESQDIMELISSPEVYIKKGGEIYPIIIKNTGYDLKTIRNDKLFNYTIKFEMAYEKLSNI